MQKSNEADNDDVDMDSPTAEELFGERDTSESDPFIGSDGGIADSDSYEPDDEGSNDSESQVRTFVISKHV